MIRNCPQPKSGRILSRKTDARFGIQRKHNDMTNVGRNDPCPCGSGKKYKQCCLLETGATRQTGDRSEAVPKAIDWLTATRGQAVREALDDQFFGGLDDDEYEKLMGMDPDSLEGIMINAMEWLLADGTIAVKGQERRVTELLFARGGPVLSAGQREWIELLASKPIRLYEVAEVIPGESMRQPRNHRPQRGDLKEAAGRCPRAIGSSSIAAGGDDRTAGEAHPAVL